MNSSTTVKNVKTQALEPNTLTSSRQSRNSPFLSIASAGRISSPHRKRYGDNVATDGIVDTFHTNKDNGDKSLKNLSGCGEKEYIWKQCHDNNTAYSDGSGCVVCKKDDDHAKLLICEACNAEYHIYCLKPPLKSVPDGDFYCGKCHEFTYLARKSAHKLSGELWTNIFDSINLEMVFLCLIYITFSNILFPCVKLTT